MRHTFHTAKPLILLTLCLLACGMSKLSARDIPVEAYLEKNQIAIGESTRLSIRVNSALESDVSIPYIADINVRHAGVSKSTSIIGGSISTMSIHTFLITPNKPGTFTIPPFTVTIRRETYTTEPLTLTVSSNPDHRSAMEGIAFIQISLDKDSLYVGEIVQAKVRLFISANARIDSIRSLPEFKSDAVLLSPLGNKPVETLETVSGQRFRVFSWETNLTALRRGSAALEAYAEVDVLTPVQRQSPFPQSIFDDDFFGTSWQRTPMRVFSNSLEVDIKPVPTPPAGLQYTGAVGRFQMKVGASPTQLTAGDPITVTVTITGSGNFDRVFHNGISDAEGWRIYAPQGSFTPSDRFPLAGEKVFRQAIIPTDPRITAIPSQTFVFFDPEKADFVTLRSNPIPVNVRNAPGQPFPTSSIGESSDTSDPMSPPDPVTRLVDISLHLDHPITAFQPLIRSTHLIAWLLIPLLFIPLLTYLPIAIIRQLNKNETRLKMTLRVLERDIHSALLEEDKVAFVQAATAYSKHLLADRWKVTHHSLTSADIKARLGIQNPALLALFSNNEIIQYSGTPEKDLDIHTLHEGLVSEWKLFSST